MEIKESKNPMAWEADAEGWYVVNDGVMGGISKSETALTDRNTLLFSGTVSMENNGGFASIRNAAASFSLADGSGIRLRVKGDGKAYQLRVRTSNSFDGMAYKADFKSEKEVWKEFLIPWEQFTATFRGNEVKGAPELKGANIQQVGFLIADKQEGSFKLEIAFLGSFGDNNLVSPITPAKTD